MTASTSTPRSALVIYPESERYTSDALRKAFKAVLPDWDIYTSRINHSEGHKAPPALQFCDYDEIDWDDASRSDTLVNAYMLRKALIRKSYLCVTVRHHLSKHPTSLLRTCVPKTYPFEISHADELDELFYDELYDLAQALDEDQDKGNGERRWWIVKPAMADKGQGIRLFDSRDALQRIFESFEDDESDDEDGADGKDEAAQEDDVQSTKVSLSHMRDWVIQEYIASPLLIDPLESPDSHSLPGRKFHLRVYVLAVGALQVYVYTDVLALFASSPYAPPWATTTADDDNDGEDPALLDLAAHLTNTCLQSSAEAESSVFLLSHLVGKRILSTSADDSPEQQQQQGEGARLTAAQVDAAVAQIGAVVGETFRAGLGMPNHFSVAENGFEVFGLDFLLSAPVPGASGESSGELGVHLLEVNACPDFKQSGAGLHGVIGRLFEGVLELAVKPFFAPEEEGEEGDVRRCADWAVGERRGSWIKCCDASVVRNAKPW